MSKKETEKAGRKLSIPGLILSAVMLVLTVIFLILAFHTQMIPTSYMVILCVIGFAVWLAAFLLMKKPGRKVRFIIGIIWMIICKRQIFQRISYSPVFLYNRSR